MARFDVFRSRRSNALLLEVQADVHHQLETRVMVPLLSATAGLPSGLPRLHPSFDINGKEVRMATHLIGATSVRDIGERVGTLEAKSYEIVSALDVLLTGV